MIWLIINNYNILIISLVSIKNKCYLLLYPLVDKSLFVSLLKLHSDSLFSSSYIIKIHNYIKQKELDSKYTTRQTKPRAHWECISGAVNGMQNAQEPFQQNTRKAYEWPLINDKQRGHLHSSKNFYYVKFKRDRFHFFQQKIQLSQSFQCQ